MNALTSPLLTDLYQLTMWEAYLSEGMDETAAFEFYVRDLPTQRGFLIASGLESLLSFLENLSFSAGEIAYLEETGRFSRKLLDRLAAFRFTGDLYALPEGTAFFAGEPLIRVVAPIGQAQFVETRAINLLHFETLIATKAARCMLASGGRAILVDFGLRRAHGAEAGLLAARASRIAGFAGTATVLAGARYGIPVFGTMAHSYIEAHENEEEAFIAYARANRDNVTLLIDTYDPLRGARRAAQAVRAQERSRTRRVACSDATGSRSATRHAATCHAAAGPRTAAGTSPSGRTASGTCARARARARSETCYPRTRSGTAASDARPRGARGRGASGDTGCGGGRR